MSERLNSIDIIRGIAMIFVIIGHEIGFFIEQGILTNTEIWEHIVEFIYLFHMPLFFCVSGYLDYCGSRKNKVSLKESIIKGIMSLYLPYVATNLLYWIERVLAKVVLGVNIEGDVSISIKSFLQVFLMRGWVTWFLLSLLVIKIINYVIEYVGKRHVLILIYLSFFVAYCFFNENEVLYYLSWGIFYYCGYLVNRRNVVANKKKLIMIMVTNVVALVLFFFVGSNPILKLLFGVTLFVEMLSGFARSNPVWGVSFCGKHSMVVYVVHGLLQNICFRVLIVLFSHPLVLLFLLTVLQVVIAKGICVFMENIKCMKWISYIFYPYKLYTNRRVKG